MKKERYESKFEFKQKGKERNKNGESESEYQQLHSRVVKMARSVDAVELCWRLIIVVQYSNQELSLERVSDEAG